MEGPGRRPSPRLCARPAPACLFRTRVEVVCSASQTAPLSVAGRYGLMWRRALHAPGPQVKGRVLHDPLRAKYVLMFAFPWFNRQLENILSVA